MQALWLENQQLSYRTDLDIPEPQDDEALVKVRLAGICTTDLQLIQGYYPFTGILGHEFVGEIIKAPTAQERVGERVVGEINQTCGHCRECLAERHTHCVNRRVLGIINHHGAFADYLVLPIKNLHSVPESISDENAVFVEPLAAALHIQQQINIQSSDKVLIIGAGKLGQLIAHTLALTGCDLTVVARYATQRALLSPIPCLAQIPDTAFDVVIEATGSPDGLHSALSAVRPCGTIILKSTFAASAKLNLSSLVVNEIQLLGSRCGKFAPALQLLAQGLVQPHRLISQQYALRDGLIAMQHAANQGMMKVLLYP